MGDREQLRARLQAKLRPERIRATLEFAGLYQITHELIKEAVLAEVRQFYSWGFGKTGFEFDEARFQAEVRSRHPREFRAALLWLVEANAITLEQADRLDGIYKYRHEMSHELMKYIIDPDFEPDMELFGDALQILRAIRRYWVEVEISMGSYEEHGDVTVDDVAPGTLLVLQMCIDAFLDGLPGATEDSAETGIQPTT